MESARRILLAHTVGGIESFIKLHRVNAAIKQDGESVWLTGIHGPKPVAIHTVKPNALISVFAAS